MPCYTAWNTLLRPGTPEYMRAEAELRTKLRAIKHIVDYYYSVNGLSTPNLPDGVDVDPTRQPKSLKERAVRKSICHHFACDEIGVSVLYDVCTLLDLSQNEDRSCAAVLLPCASLLREKPDQFKTVY